MSSGSKNRVEPVVASYESSRRNGQNSAPSRFLTGRRETDPTGVVAVEGLDAMKPRI